MSELENEDLDVLTGKLSPEGHNPITPLPLSDPIIPPTLSMKQTLSLPVKRTEQQQRQLIERVSGTFVGEDVSFQITGPITAITEATPIVQISVSTTYTDTKGRAPMELLMWAVISHFREYKVLPGGIYVSMSLSFEVRDELKGFYGEKHGDALDRPLTIQRIPISFMNIHRHVVICVR